jgi:aminoglycoside phosphotransferase (APT) family kinase protein
MSTLAALKLQPRLPGAELLRDRSRLARCLRPLLQEVEAAELVSCQPQRRAVLRVAGRAERGPRSVYVKLLKRGTFERLAAVLPALPERAAGLRLALPCLWLEPEAAIVLEPAEGRWLHAALLEGEAAPVEALARALGALRQIAIPHGTPEHGMEAEKAATLRMLERGAKLLPPLRDLAARVRELELPAAAARGLLHRDLHDKQIFFTSGQVELIDLDSVAAGDPRLDVVNLAEHLRLRALQEPGRCQGEAARQALFDALGLDGREPSVLLLAALVRARLAGVYAQRPHRVALSARLARDTHHLLRQLP